MGRDPEKPTKYPKQKEPQYEITKEQLLYAALGGSQAAAGRPSCFGMVFYLISSMLDIFLASRDLYSPPSIPSFTVLQRP